jgi:hypothetical protein
MPIGHWKLKPPSTTMLMNSEASDTLNPILRAKTTPKA